MKTYIHFLFHQLIKFLGIAAEIIRFCIILSCFKISTGGAVFAQGTQRTLAAFPVKTDFLYPSADRLPGIFKAQSEGISRGFCHNNTRSELSLPVHRKRTSPGVTAAAVQRMRIRQQMVGFPYIFADQCIKGIIRELNPQCFQLTLCGDSGSRRTCCGKEWTRSRIAGIIYVSIRTGI